MQREHDWRPIPGTAVGILPKDTLAPVEDFTAFARAVEMPTEGDASFRHASETIARVNGHRLRRDVNFFGSGNSPAIPHFNDGVYKMHEAETVVLRDAVFSPHSMTVCRVGRGFYRPSLENYFLVSPTLERVAAMDPLYVVDQAGVCRFSERASSLELVDATAFPVCGTGFWNYGHFLYDGLSLALLLTQAMPNWAPILVGPPLTDWQRTILELVGLADNYRPQERPAVFRKVVASNLMSLHVSYPTRFVRPLFDMIRFKVGASEAFTGGKVFISRRHDIAKRMLRNRDEVERCFRDEGFTVVVPEQMSFAEQVKLFSSCRFVAGESGAGFANIGFCDPGTKILEIQPDNFVEGWTRSASMLFSHDWNVFFAESSPIASDPLGKPLPPHTMEFSVVVADLRAAIRAIAAR
jgi:capsular polysaccharide biosynthesis protein